MNVFRNMLYMARRFKTATVTYQSWKNANENPVNSIKNE